MKTKQGSSPTFLKRFKTRLRSMSRGKDEVPEAKVDAPPIPNMGVPKNPSITLVVQAPTSRPHGPVRRMSKASLLAAFSNKSTASLVKNASAETQTSDSKAPPPYRSALSDAVPLPEGRGEEVAQGKDVDPTLVPLPESPIISSLEVDGMMESPTQEKHNELELGGTVTSRRKIILQESPDIIRSRQSPESPVSKRSAIQSGSRSSKFFV
ncbi:hypothetical protein DACRYDRAFT_24305, partial [Dacryopinax primogenitus]